MVEYFIVCRSLTSAQRTEAALSRVGIPAHILRSPKIIDSEGCNYSVKVGEQSLARALTVLAGAGLSPKLVFVTYGDGDYREVFP